MNYLARRDRLRHQLQLTHDEVFLVTSLINVSYLTGFTGSSAWLLITADREWLLSDTRYESQLTVECPDVKCKIRDASSSQLATLSQVVESSNFRTVRYEAESITKSTFDQLESKLEGVDLASTTQVVEQLRAIKDADEISAIRKSIQVNQAAFEQVRDQLHPAQTELEIAHLLEHHMRQLGASGVAFAPSVAVGTHSALPHGKPSAQRIDADSFFLIDWGARVNQYASDLTRILVTSKIPPKMRDIYDVVLSAQAAAIASVEPGVELKVVDAAARSFIVAAGYGDYFGHGLGHGFGLEIHEAPFMTPIAEGKLMPGMVITIEPGIYVPDLGGVRIEDDILVTQDGCEVLSDIPKEFDQCFVKLR